MAVDQSPESTSRGANGNMLEKLQLTFPTELDNQSGPCQFRSECCNIKTLVKQVGALLLFHLMNIGVAILGVIAVVVMIAGISLNLLWVVALVVFAIGAIPFILVSLIPDRLRCLVIPGYTVLMLGYLALYIFSLLNLYTALAPYVLLAGGGIGYVLVYLSVSMNKFVVKADIRLTNFVLPFCCSTSEETLDREDCPEPIRVDASSGFWILPSLTLTAHAWIVILYFGFCKVTMGVMSTAAVFCVVQPVVSLCSGGGAPFLVWLMTSHQDPIVYFAVIDVAWIMGVVGLFWGAKLSVKLASCVFGEKKANEEEGGIEAGISSPTTGFVAA